MIVDPLSEAVRPLTLPVLESVHGASPIQDGLRELAVEEVDIAHDGLRQVLAALEAMALKSVLDPAVEPLEHAVRLRSHRGRETVLNAEFRAEQVELGLVTVWCRSFDHVMCSKGDEPWAQAGRMNFARMRFGSR